MTTGQRIGLATTGAVVIVGLLTALLGIWKVDAPVGPATEGSLLQAPRDEPSVGTETLSGDQRSTATPPDTQSHAEPLPQITPKEPAVTAAKESAPESAAPGGGRVPDVRVVWDDGGQRSRTGGTLPQVKSNEAQKATFRLTVDPAGKVRGVQTVRSSHTGLERLGKEKLRGWTFQPLPSGAAKKNRVCTVTLSVPNR